MALTMTRNRTQTTLTRLAELVANVHGELEFVGELLKPETVPVDNVRTKLEARRSSLLHNRDALYRTIEQFDPSLHPEQIGISDQWRRRFGTKNLSTKGLVRRYLAT